MHPTIIAENISDHPEEISLTVNKNEILYYLVYGFSNATKQVSVNLVGEGAEAYILGILLGNEGQCVLNTLQDHQAPNTKSDLLVRTILGGDAVFNYQGKIVIEREAQQSNAYQRNENILLSNHARVDTKPELEILANDVRCTHGATVGKLDAEQVFYLQSRGLELMDAERLMLKGFLERVVKRLPDDKVQRRLQTWIEKELSEITLTTSSPTKI